MREATGSWRTTNSGGSIRASCDSISARAKKRAARETSGIGVPGTSAGSGAPASSSAVGGILPPGGSPAPNASPIGDSGALAWATTRSMPARTCSGVTCGGASGGRTLSRANCGSTFGGSPGRCGGRTSPEPPEIGGRVRGAGGGAPPPPARAARRSAGPRGRSPPRSRGADPRRGPPTATGRARPARRQTDRPSRRNAQGRRVQDDRGPTRALDQNRAAGVRQGGPAAAAPAGQNGGVSVAAFWEAVARDGASGVGAVSSVGATPPASAPLIPSVLRAVLSVVRRSASLIARHSPSWNQPATSAGGSAARASSSPGASLLPPPDPEPFHGLEQARHDLLGRQVLGVGHLLPQLVERDAPPVLEEERHPLGLAL